MSYRLLTIGDSIVWGQGLADAEKFRVNLRERLRQQLGAPVTLIDRSHSGAVLAPCPDDADPKFVAWHGEVPRFAPSVCAQWQAYAQLGQVPDVVLLNGGINDVGFPLISSLADCRTEIAQKVGLACGQAMLHLLKDLVLATGRPRVIVTGYYAAISHASGLASLLRSPNAEPFLDHLRHLHGDVPGLADLPREPLLPDLLGHLADNWETFAAQANARLSEAVQAVNEHLGEPRVWFVDPAIGAEHAMFTPEPYLFNPGLPPRDSAAEARRKQCFLCYSPLAHPLELGVCLEASTGHPNVLGANRYLERILAAALPEIVRQIQGERAAGPGPAPEGIGPLAGGVALVSPYDPEILTGALHLKGQLHAHWYDDGPMSPAHCRTPLSLAHAYHALGYQFLAFTEHNDKHIIDYTRTHPGCGSPGTCLVSPTAEVCDDFTEIARSEEVTPHHHHLLAFGVADEIGPCDCQNDPPFASLAEIVTQREHGVAFLPHPRQYYDADYHDFHQQITLPGSMQTHFSAISVRTAASREFWRDSLCLWDVLLRQGVCTVTPDARTILLPAYSEDDYAPLGLPFVTLGSTWIELEIDTAVHPWPAAAASPVRQTTLLAALRSGRWWTYWVDYGEPWSKDRPYPHFDLRTDQRTITVTPRDLDVSSVSFITARRSADHKRINAGQPVTYECQGDDLYVRVAAECDGVGLEQWKLHACSNAVWVKQTTATPAPGVPSPESA